MEEVLAKEGDSVAAGQTLVRLDDSEWRTNLDEAKALADATARELDLLRAGTRPETVAQAEAEAKRLELLWTVASQGARPEEIAAARQELRAAEAASREADATANRITELARTGRATGSELDRAVADRDTAKARVAVDEQRLQLLEKGGRPEEIEASRQSWVAAQEHVKALKAGARPEEVAAKRATLEAAQARIRLAETRLKELKVVAPAAGYVQTLDLRPGDLLRGGDPVAVLLLAEEPWITIYVPEADLARVKVGQEAEVLPDGHAPLSGRVTWISRRAEYSPRNVQTKGDRVTQVFAARVTLAGDVSALKDGMWADVRLR